MPLKKVSVVYRREIEVLFSVGHSVTDIKAISDQKHGKKSSSVSAVKRWVK